MGRGRQKSKLGVAGLLVVILGSVGGACDRESAPPPKELAYEVAGEYPHDPDAFTQGLVWIDGVLYESTGRRGQSEVRRVDLQTGTVLQSRSLPEHLFGEGLAHVDGRLYQLTWRGGEGFVYSVDSLRPAGAFAYDGEGWGLAFDGEHLILGDGSPKLRFLDPESFQVVREIEVRSDEGPVHDVNELEFIEGYLWANVWRRDTILQISPADGRVIAELDLSGLLRPRPSDPNAVLNGIAWDPDRRLMLVTGKLWPKLFALRIL